MMDDGGRFARDAVDAGSWGVMRLVSAGRVVLSLSLICTGDPRDRA